MFLDFLLFFWFFTDCTMGFITMKNSSFGKKNNMTFSNHPTNKSKFFRSRGRMVDLKLTLPEKQSNKFASSRHFLSSWNPEGSRYVLRFWDFPYNPITILGIGCFDHQSYEKSGRVWILREYHPKVVPAPMATRTSIWGVVIRRWAKICGRNDAPKKNWKERNFEGIPQ